MLWDHLIASPALFLAIERMSQPDPTQFPDPLTDLVDRIDIMLRELASSARTNSDGVVTVSRPPLTPTIFSREYAWSLTINVSGYGQKVVRPFEFKGVSLNACIEQAHALLDLLMTLNVAPNRDAPRLRNEIKKYHKGYRP
jgi:hypothetical protein